MSWGSSAETQERLNAETRRRRDAKRGNVSALKATEVVLLPEEWEVVPFAAAIRSKRISAGKVKKRDYLPTGEFPIVDQGQDFIGGYWNDPEPLYEGNLPVVIFGDHTRIFKFVDFPFIRGADGVKVLVPNRKRFNPRFFYYACRHLEIPSKGYSRHYKLLKEQILPCPPIPEQRRIAGALRTIQEALAVQEDVITAARELKRSLLERVFTYGPSAEPASTKETEIGEIPEHWGLRPAGQLFARVTDGTHDTPEKLAEGIPLVTSKLLKGGDIQLPLADYFISPEDHDEIGRRSGVQPWDVLYSMIGTIGEVAVVRPEHSTFSIKNVGLFKADGHQLLAEFTAYWLRTRQARAFVDLRASGTSQRYVPLGLLRELPIPFPSTHERRQIVAVLSAADARITAEEQRKAALEELFRSALEQLMTGQIRINARKNTCKPCVSA